MAILRKKTIEFAKQHMNGDTTLFEGAIDLYNHFKDLNTKSKDKKNFEYDATISFDKKCAKMHKLMMEEINKLAGVPANSILSPQQNFSNPQYKWATFQIIGALVDPIIPDTIIDSIGMFTNVQTGDYGDSFTYDIESNDLFYVTKAGRATRHSEANKTFRGQVPILPIEHDISTMASLYRLLSGQENLAVFAMKCVRAIETEMAYNAYSVFDATMSALPQDVAADNSGLRYAGFTTDTFIKLTDKVAAFNSGSKPIALGTRSAVSKILPSNSNYRYMLDSDYVKLGYVQEFNGIDVLVLPQKANWQQPYKTLLNDNSIYVLSPASQKPVQLAIEGSTLAVADDQYQNANLTQQITFKKNWGVDVASNATYGVITLS